MGAGARWVQAGGECWRLSCRSEGPAPGRMSPRRMSWSHSGCGPGTVGGEPHRLIHKDGASVSPPLTATWESPAIQGQEGEGALQPIREAWRFVSVTSDPLG